jgi:hypothetical protein
MDSWLMVLFLVIIVVIGAVALLLIGIGRKGHRTLDVDKYRQQWLAVERLINRDDPSSYQLAILNADKLLGQALQQSGYKGQTMGERMKTAQSSWSNANNVWYAHKLRNQIAHEPDVSIRYDDARRALSCFKQALKDVGAI